ncbi:hypothetical protein DM860_014593 [Cuscuta australis]|uniref:Uncharacterized protein n=1 Tax=Cuscuta australis TaxID=267555 RepID=A0A328DMD0_9ASTE|nr:hypothetical protein DM860_014593 [Cuscuta australis]
MQTGSPANPIQQHIVSHSIWVDLFIDHLREELLCHVNLLHLAPAVYQDGIDLAIDINPPFLLIEHLGGNSHVPVLAEGIEEIAEVQVPDIVLSVFIDEDEHFAEGANGLPSKSGRNESPDQNVEGREIGRDFLLFHLDDELPSDIELPDFGEDVDEEVEGGGVQRGTGVGLGEIEKSEGDFGRVSETEEGLVDEERGKGNSGELKG